MNKSAIVAIVLITIAVVASPALAADADTPITLGHHGFYGRLEFGDDTPRPRVYFTQPRLVERVAAFEDPIYLHVRPGQSRDWQRHCREYDACGRHVYFVNDDWYNTIYVPHYRDRDNPERPDGNFGHPDSADLAA